MHRQYQFNIDRIEGAIDSVLLRVSSDKAYVDKAYSVYRKLAEAYPEGVDEGLFNSWLVHSHVSARLKAEALEGDSEMLDVLNSASFSLFKVWRNKQYLVFEDIFTKRQFPVPEQCYPGIFDFDALHLLHIFTVRGEHYIAGDSWSIEQSQQTTIVQEVLKQYHAAKHLGAYTIEGFLRDTPLLLYWMVQTMNALVAENLEVDYSVYEVACAMETPNALKALLALDTVAESILEGVYTISLPELNPIDFCVEGKRLVFDCPEEGDAEGLRQWLESDGEAMGILFLDARRIALDELLDSDSEAGAEAGAEADAGLIADTDIAKDADA